ncbi:hypothetical protein FISHEDRAFT_45002 [Fistulina hepatica ATCC 64428]|uniref:CxC1-like cysteine cluster associated with KDZ transposases domain-containing protein n=1 Tax=Fistulina hepatica ATCC 64428 TaxID=1128425 RepID=A0A0D7A9Q0_9AGAR|nr:hypothetical protein FISHEDRAFT_45002 [Fistulina hepatica ATCC 64428]
MNSNNVWEDDDNAALSRSAFSVPAPGEEGAEFSHAGAEGTLYTIVHSMVGRKHRIDMRMRRDRMQKQLNDWQHQLPALKDAYLQWKAHGPADNEDEDSLATCWSITVYSFRGIRQEFFRNHAGASINKMLALHGLIGALPVVPHVAFTFHFLKMFRQLHRVCPRFSIDAAACVLHNLHQRPRKPYLTQQLSNAYDVYLSIQRIVTAEIQAALKRADLEIQAHLLCTPCMYRLKDEATLQPSMLATCDGNNSLKLVDAAFRIGDPRIDNRTLPSFRYLEPEAVNVFKDDVANAAAAARRLQGSASTSSSLASGLPLGPNGANSDDIAWVESKEMGQDVVGQVDACVERWHAASPDAKKRMVELFAVAGVFLTLCRHGHVLVICDMICSGEL